MSQEKIECIILTDDGIMIQEITFMRRTGHEHVLRIPSIEEITKITEGCTNSLKTMEEAKKHDEKSTELLDMIFGPTVERFGRENVTINEDKSLTVIDNGKSHRIWIE